MVALIEREERLFMWRSLFRRAGAECFGTYALVTAGCGAIMVNALTGTLTHIGIAFTFGLIIMVMVAATGHISGAHFNPRNGCISLQIRGRLAMS